VRSPFHSEPEAFRFLLLVILAMLVIVLAAVLGSTWLALAVLAIIVGALAMRITQLRMRRSLEVPLKSAPPHLGPAAERRVLVVANDTLSEQGLLSEVAMLASAPGTHVLLLAPALISPGVRVAGAVDRPLDQARVRLAAALDRVGHDLDVEGEVSAADPLEAIENAFATFAADEVIVCTRRERARNGLEPRLAGLVRERFAVPVRHLVLEPGCSAQEPDKDTEARYHNEAVTRKGRQVVLETLAVVGILASLLMSMIALIRSDQRRTEVAPPTAVLRPTGAAASISEASLAAAKVVDVSVIPEYKLGPDGKKHDAFTKTEFAVKVGQPLKLRIDNTDTQPHSLTSPEVNVNITAMPGTHTYTLIVTQPGKYQWFCVYPCDSGANGWAMKHPGYMSGYITAS
jgi:plastocyanin